MYNLFIFSGTHVSGPRLYNKPLNSDAIIMGENVIV